MLDGFYVDILLTDSEKAEILRKNRGILSPVKNCGDYYSFEKTLLIHNISEANVKAESPQATTGFWYVEVCFVNFFDACESLYRLLLCVHAAKPDLHYRILKTDFIFQEEPIEQFIGQVYLCVRHYKRYYNHVRGTLSVMVGRDYETFRRRNFKRFEKEQGDISILLRNIEYLTECAAELAQSAEAQHERLKPLGDTGTYTLSYDWNFPAEKEQLELLKKDGYIEETTASLYKEIDEAFREQMKEPVLKDNNVWTLDALLCHPFWEEQRRKAGLVYRAFCDMQVWARLRYDRGI